MAFTVSAFFLMEKWDTTTVTFLACALEELTRGPIERINNGNGGAISRSPAAILNGGGSDYVVVD